MKLLKLNIINIINKAILRCYIQNEEFDFSRSIREHAVKKGSKTLRISYEKFCSKSNLNPENNSLKNSINYHLISGLINLIKKTVKVRCIKKG